MNLLGKTGVRVGRIGFGGAQIGFEKTEQRHVEEIVNLLQESGNNVIDTASFYRESEWKIGKAIRGKRQDFFLSTKCGLRPGQPDGRKGRLIGVGKSIIRHPAILPDWNPRLMQWSIEQSLRNLQTEYIDLIQLHSCAVDQIAQGVQILERAKAAGKTRAIGYSGDGEAALYAVRCGQLDVLQISVNIADQNALREVLPAAKQQGMGVIAKRPLANVLWKLRQRPENQHNHAYWERLQLLNYEFPDDGIEEALQFTLTVPEVDVAIVGTTSPKNFSRDIAVSRRKMDADRFVDIRRRWEEVAAPGWVGQT